MLSSAVKELQAAKKEIATKIQGLAQEAKKIDNAIKVLAGLSIGGGVVTAKGKNRRTPAQRAAMAKAQKARWAKKKAGKAAAAKPVKKRKKMSAAARARIAAFQKARWAKIKAAKKK